MDKNLRHLHLKAGFIIGKEKTCDNKINYAKEERAIQAAEKMNNKKSTRNTLEAYPCAFCNGWHIGREMSIIELESHLNGSDSRLEEEVGWAEKGAHSRRVEK